MIPDADLGYLRSYDVGYVSNTRPLWPRMIDYIRTGATDGVFDVFDRWRHSVEVAHGLSFVLPIVRVAFGRKLRIVRIVRERTAHVESLAKRVKINPGHWGGYADPETPVEIPRPTAVDFGEMPAAAWWRLTTEQRFDWYLAKQAELFERDKGLFDEVSEMRTEDLSKTQTVARCAELLGPGFIADVPPVHVHQTVQFDLTGMSEDDLRTIEEVWEQLDYVRAIRDRSYPLRFFFDATMRLRERDPVQAEPILRELAARLARAGVTPD